MRTLDALLKLAADCYAHARLSSSPLTKTELTVMGDEYFKQAEELRRRGCIMQAVYPKPDVKNILQS
jgi:hypothetical protein